MPTTTKYLKLFMFSFVFVIHCVLCQMSYPIPEPNVQVLKPKGFRISIANTSEIPNFVQFVVSGLVLHEKSKRPVDAFGPVILTSTEDRLQYENKFIYIKQGQRIKYDIIARHKDRRHDLNEESYEFINLPKDVVDRGDFTQVDECDWSKTISKGKKVCQGEIIFFDNFVQPYGDYGLFWRPEIRMPLDTDDADFVLYLDYKETVYTKDGNLFIQPICVNELPGYTEAEFRSAEVHLDRACTGVVDPERECSRKPGLFTIRPPVVSARLTTKSRFSFRYGRIEVRAKLPKGDWLFPLITLDPLTSDYGATGYASGQMRVAFIRGNEQLKTKEGWAIDGSYLSAGVILKPGVDEREKWLRTVRGSEHWGNTFHTYSLTWTDTDITLAYDGFTYATIGGGFNSNSTVRMAPFDKEFYISLGVSAGGISDFPDRCVSNNVNKPWDNTSPKAELQFWKAINQWGSTWDATERALVVDYVKVWAL